MLRKMMRLLTRIYQTTNGINIIISTELTCQKKSITHRRGFLLKFVPSENAHSLHSSCNIVNKKCLPFMSHQEKYQGTAMPIRSCAPRDTPAICGIYNHYIAHTVVTFEEQPVSVTEMQKRINTHTELFPWLVYEDNEKVLGYAYASKWKDRSAYKYTAEVTVYLHPQHCGQGIGSELYKVLIEQLAKNGIHVLLACIAVPNAASEKIHQQFGFRQVAHFREIGFKFGRWLDIGYWQKNL